jgi:hypothetical protein
VRRGAGFGQGGVLVVGPGDPAANLQVVEDRAGRRLGAAEERRQVRVGLLDGRRRCLQQVQHLPVPARQARLPEHRVEAAVDQAVDQLQPEPDRAPLRGTLIGGSGEGHGMPPCLSRLHVN